MAEPQTRPRFPWLATLVVAAAVGFMVHLGFWQLDRLHQKEAMIAQFEAARASTLMVPYPNGDLGPFPYSHVQTVCAVVLGQTAVSGENATHQSGWAHVVDCRVEGGARVKVRLGWSDRPAPVAWTGGTVTGVIIPEKINAPADWHIVADPPLAGLQANARPDPRDLPNNHFSYAVQWFLFAATAAVIYGLALRKRLKGKG